MPNQPKFFLSLIIILLIGLACSTKSDAPKPQPAPDNVADTKQVVPATSPVWEPEAITILRQLWLGSLPTVPSDPSNAVADNLDAAALGHKLFFEARLSANNQIACASCHQPALMFTDGVPLSFGARTTQRNAITLVGSAYSPWLLWDGRQDSLWAQALDPIEHPDEQGTTRLHAVHLIDQDPAYRAAYEAVFGSLPPDLSDFSRFPDSGGPVAFPPYRATWETMRPDDQATVTQIYVNLGKAIAAYERLILPGPARFDTYVEAILAGDLQTAENTLAPDEVAGLRLFIGRANCIRCHAGPLFTDNAFHNTGLPIVEGRPSDEGRAIGIRLVLANPFNCLSQYSDAAETDCVTLHSARETGGTFRYAFKTPTLRNITETAPYMHTGALATLPQVLDHYNQAPTAPAGQTELVPLGLTQTELAQLAAFLGSLGGPLAMPPEWLMPPDN